MSIPVKEKVISKIQEYLKVTLSQMPRKRIIYNGKLSNGKRILVCTPQSRLHTDGKGWIDITAIQVSMFKEADYSILAFRVEGNRVYYFNFNDLRPFLTEGSMYNNVKEGDHWKLYIWPNYIQILGNKSHMKVKPNNLEELSRL